MDNLLSYCGLVDARISTSNKDLPVQGLVAKLEEAHPSALCLVLTGHGNSFAAGADLNWLEERSNTPPADNIEIMKNYYNYFTGLTTLSIPTIAAINGPAVGAGFCVSMFCDIRITSADSKLGANFVKLGINPGMGGTFTMPLKVPSQVAWELLLTGKIMSGMAIWIVEFSNGVYKIKKRFCLRINILKENC